MSMPEKLLSYITSMSELLEHANYLNSPVRLTYKECLSTLTNPNLINEKDLFKINTVLDYLHDELNTGHWSKVSNKIRRVFTICSFVKAYITLKIKENFTEEILETTLKCIDLGLLLGAPLNENSDVLLNDVATYLTQELNNLQPNSDNANVSNLNEDCKKRRISICSEYENLQATEVSTLKCPSIDKFDKEYFQLQVPVKLTDCINHWPAITKWQDVNYLLKIAGNRTVPVEIGSHYADENWSQKLMTLKDFIKSYYLEKSSNLGYLAQHNLFDQISELRNDICIPEYCCLSRNYDDASDPDINAWFGPEDTVSPLHFDPKDNLLAQVFGTKQVILFPPEDSRYLYPHQDKLLFNTARVNPLQADLEKFPDFKKAKMYKCLLKSEEILFIPEKWWHHVSALKKSFSVSFWWK